MKKNSLAFKTLNSLALESKTISQQNGDAAVASWSSPDGSTFLKGG